MVEIWGYVLAPRLPRLGFWPLTGHNPGLLLAFSISGLPSNFVRWGGSTNSVEDRGQREQGSGCGSPLVRGSGGSRNLEQEI